MMGGRLPSTVMVALALQAGIRFAGAPPLLRASSIPPAAGLHPADRGLAAGVRLGLSGSVDRL